MTIEKNSFVKISEINLVNTQATIFQKNSNENFQTGLIFSESINKARENIPIEDLEFFFVKLMNINIKKLLNKNCELISKSIKFSDEIELNKLLISSSCIIKKTTNLVFAKTELSHNEKKIIAFSNSIWKIN